MRDFMKRLPRLLHVLVGSPVTGRILRFLVSTRLQRLEAVAEAARKQHTGELHLFGMRKDGCILCKALAALDGRELPGKDTAFQA